MPSAELGTRDKKKIKSDIKRLTVIWKKRDKKMKRGVETQIRQSSGLSPNLVFKRWHMGWSPHISDAATT